MVHRIEQLLSNILAMVNLTREHRCMRIQEDLHRSAASALTCSGGTDQLTPKCLKSDGGLTGAALKGRFLVLVAHQDDETACAGLLQRCSDSTIVYATNGAPSDRFFWDRYGSRNAYSSVRRNEAVTAATKIGIAKLEFLECGDQDLYCALDEASELSPKSWGSTNRTS